jgi:hypothetical protein
VKQIGDQHGELGKRGTGEDDPTIPPLVSEHFIVVPISDTFDVDTIFQSERDLSETGPSDTGVAATTSDASGDLPPRDASGPTVPADSSRSSSLESVGASLSVADLIENNVRLQGYEAAAIALRLCRAMARDPAATMQRAVVEPWNVEITDHGEVRVLPGGIGGDPLVMQVGRVLGALLHDSIAPVELRLVASQASFEVPFYSSIEELSQALQYFDAPAESEAIRAAFHRGLEAKFSFSADPRPPEAAVPLLVGPYRPAQRTMPARSTVPPPRHSGGFRLAALVAAVLLPLAAALLIPARRRPSEQPIWPTGEQQGLPPPRPLTEARSQRPLTSPPPAAKAIAPQPGALTARDMKASVPHDRVRPTGRIPPTPPATHPATVGGLEAPAAIDVARSRWAVESGDALELAERRASALLASGLGHEAAHAFDSIVMRSPLHRLDSTRSSPEALAALRSSKRVLLPALARRHYEEARTAFNSGDFNRAISEGESASTLLNDDDLDAAPGDLRAAVTDVVALASAARVSVEERIYTIADPDITPPAPLGRQLPATRPPGTSSPTGRLEILVGRAGRVETVKLYTPSNGYHDRMIVSAAKAWHYKPALKNGKPVRFNLVMLINLPQS